MLQSEPESESQTDSSQCNDNNIGVTPAGHSSHIKNNNILKKLEKLYNGNMN